ncbi:hypothetical protein ACIO3S_06395 [Nocardioides sp. NPDC087217]|uniref:hypothetical protein n=1 Tax=Nocardioides sp. NPDC087217 TaxID=3364335 RepID=UPI00381B58E7
MSERKKIAQLEAKVADLERNSGRRSWMTPILSGIGVIMTGVILNATSPVVEDAVTDKPNPCLVQYESVAKAIQNGVTDASNLDALAEPGCSVEPQDVARDIQE